MAEKSKTYLSNVLKERDTGKYLQAQNNKSFLRFISCGSVDDGKSTLIGRLLYDSKMIFEDHLNQLKVDSNKLGTQGKEIDFALLVDGLAAEREQGITIDVAYRYFRTTKRKFIVADTPGHEQYTKNMVTGASLADLAIILVDARKGVLTQTRRHSYLTNLLGIKNIVLAVNKMDLVGYERKTFNRLVSVYQDFANSIGMKNFLAIPISGLNGENVMSCSKNMPWYTGPTLMHHLETVDIFQAREYEKPFRMPVQWVNRANQNFRGFAGKITSGSIKKGDDIRVLPSGGSSKVDRIVTYDGDLERAVIGQSVTITLKGEIDCTRGQIITPYDKPLEVANQFEITLIWMDEKKLVPGRSYSIKIGTQTLLATFAKPKYKINLDTLEKIATKTLGLNDIGNVVMTTDRDIPFSPYKDSRDLGGFIVMDRMTNATASAGLINFSLRRSNNIHWQIIDIKPEDRAMLKKQKPVVLWMTGLSGSGKSTIANAVEQKLFEMNYHTVLLDGDNVRHGLNKDLGFTEVDRIENIRRVGEVAKLMTDAGLIVITAFISPFRSERDMVRQIIKPRDFVEIFINTPLEIAEKRDVKGLYSKARSGKLKNFTGVDSPYEPPQKPDISIDTTKMTVDQAANIIVKMILKNPRSIKDL